MEKTLYKYRLRKFGLVEQIYFLKNNGSVYFLEKTKNESLKLLRKAMGGFDKRTNHEKPLFKLFINEIEKDYKIKCEQTKKTEIKKKPFYAKQKIKRARERINKLKEQIKKEELNLIEMQGGLK